MTSPTLHDLEREFRRAVLTHALAAAAGNVTHAARALGVQRTYMWRIVKALNVQRPAAPSQSARRAELKG